MKLILLVIFMLLVIFVPRFRCIMLHPFKTIYYLLNDMIKYVKYKRWREYKNYGTLSILTGLFGKGKTLMLTKYVRNIYKKYDNKKVYDFVSKQWKIQHIYVVSNVDIKDINYIKLKNLSDMMIYADDKYSDGVSTWIFVIDEMSTQVNSRDYKTNFSTELLNVLLTCRHYKFKIIGTAQRFNHVDALIRQVTFVSSECDKFWRLCSVYDYNAWTLENVSDITKVKPIARHCYFITDKDYKSYDTLACVENFKDNVQKGNILTDKEIIEYQTLCNNDITSSFRLKKKFRKKIN